MSHARCKRRLSERDVETICRVILVFCLLHYRGDENIKSFIWELITPPENGREPQTLLNHSGRKCTWIVCCFLLLSGGIQHPLFTSLFPVKAFTFIQCLSCNLSVCPGLSIPVPRGRKGKRVKAQSTFDVQKVEWIRKYNPDTLLIDDSYRKHLKHQCNK